MSFTTSRERAAAVIYGSCIYQLGGYGGNSNNYVAYAQYSVIDNDGNITTSWPNQSFATARADHAAVAYNGYLYVMGGYNGQLNTYYNTTQYAQINSDCSLGTWNSTTTFDTTGRGGISAFAHNGYMYVTGGINGSTNSNAVRYAPINSNGTLGTWNSTTALPTAVNRHKTLVWGNHVYQIGGTQLALPNVNNGATSGSRPNGAGYNTTHYATINDNGTLGAWQQTTSLTNDLYEFGAAVYNGYIYIHGGYSSAGIQDTSLQYMKIGLDGSLSSLTTALTSSGSRASNSIVISGNGFFYNIGGRSDANIVAAGRSTTVVYSRINGSGPGSTGSWSTTNTLNAGRTQNGVTAYNNYLYTVGGTSDGGATARNDIEFSPISRQNGALGSSTTDSHTLNNSRISPGATVYNGRLYVFGGRSGSTYYNTTEYAPIGENGALSGNFTQTTTSFGDTGRAGACVAVYSNRIYVVGGYDGSTYKNTVRYAQFLDSGDLSSWVTAGSGFTNGRSDSGCFISNNYLYVLGGRDGATNYNDVQVAKLNAGGTIDSWSYAASFNGARSNFVGGYFNGFAYIYGGCTTAGCTAGRGDLQFAAVIGNGALGPWNYAFSTETGYAPYLTSGIAYGGYMYHIGGAGVSSNSTSYAPLKILSRMGRYTRIIDLGSYGNITSITHGSNELFNIMSPGSSPITYQTANVNGIFGNPVSSTSITPNPNPCDTSSHTYTRYVKILATLDESDRHGVPDSNFNNLRANLTEIIVGYEPSRPSPDVRLHGGKTLIEGDLGPLDTCID